MRLLIKKFRNNTKYLRLPDVYQIMFSAFLYLFESFVNAMWYL